MTVIAVAFVILLFAAITVSVPPQQLQKEWTRRLYSAYLQRFNKSLTRLEDPSSYQTFLNTVTFVHHHNQARRRLPKGKHSLRLTQFADMTEDELRAFFVSFPSRRTTMDTVTMQSTTDLLTEQDFASLWSLLFDEDAVGRTEKTSSEESLNWATADNPLKQTIVSHIYNQGSCGACWAFVSSSMTQAMIKIDLLRSSSSPSTVSVEVPRLSAQQLIDCDTNFNRGCYGGNPFMALDYIIEHGLVADSYYPYNGRQDGWCAANDRNRRLDEDLGNSTTLLQSSGHIARFFVSRKSKVGGFNEDAMLRALQKGPISVGVCGTDMSFLYYSAGIYDEEDCCLVQNHAMLIVGYGYDEEIDMRYWIALNSWGEYWGERGFMRISRGGSQNNIAGTCGINVDPVQAIGGYVLGADGSLISTTDGNSTSSSFSSWQYYFHRLEYYWSSHWVEISITFSACLMFLSFLMLMYSLYLDRIIRMKARIQASAMGYSELEMTEDGKQMELSRCQSTKKPCSREECPSGRENVTSSMSSSYYQSDSESNIA